MHRATSLVLLAFVTLQAAPAARTVAARNVAAPAALTETGASTFRGRDGATHSFAELQGHPAVVNFWATWCGPCRDEMPRLQKLSEHYAPAGVRFIAISLDDAQTQDRIDAVTAKRGFHLPVWTGATDATLLQLKLGVLVPATLILDADGEAIGRIEGEASEKDIRTRLDWLLGGRVGRQPRPVQKNDW